MKIVADNKIPFLKGVFEPYAEVVYLPGGKITAAELKDVDALITRTRTKCTRELLEKSALRIIATATIGFDHIDTAACAELGIPWKNAPGCNANSVGQYILSALMLTGMELKGKTLGVIGVGHVGSIVARYAEFLGMKVLRNDPPRAAAGESGFTGLEEVLALSDAVTLHVPLERGGQFPTFHMADESFFAKLKPGAWFFNASRGEAMKTETVKCALKQEKIAGAVIDVWENEPEIDRELLDMAMLGTPHIAGYSTDGKVNGTTASVRTVARTLNIPELFDWSPSTVPEAPQTQEISFTTLQELLLHTYDPRGDSGRLKNSPESFEELRGSYPIRREYPFFRVKNAPAEMRPLLEKLGFSLIG